VVTHSLELAPLLQKRLELDDGRLVDPQQHPQESKTG
jgi:hypothetical protein